MNELPDEILIKIFSHLLVQERLPLEQVCKRWSILMPYNISQLDLVETFIPAESLQKVKIFPVNNVDVTSLLKRCGQQLQEISFGKNYLLIPYRIIDYVREYCPILNTLDLSYCTVTDDIVSSLTHLSDRLINLNFNNTIFSIRNFDHHKDNMAILFSDMNRLEKINLQKTSVHNLSAINFLSPSLKSLNLNSCSPLRIDILVDLLTRCTNLEELRLSAYTQLSQFILETICSLKKLKVLELSHMAFGEIVFHVDHDESFDFSIIKELSELQELYVQYNNKVNDRVLSDICGNCIKLKTLNISYCRHLDTFASLSYLHNLQNIYMAASTITDYDIEQMIKRCPLKIFHAISCSIGESSVRTLVENCPQIKELCLNQCDTINSDCINLLLQKCSSLHCLSLQGANVDHTIFDSLLRNSLDSLTVLDVSYCRRFDETGILKLNQYLTEKRLLLGYAKKICIYAHQTKVTKNIRILVDPSLLVVQL